MCIADAPCGTVFKVEKVTLQKEVGKRLADMGFTSGAEGTIVRPGFLWGPMQIKIRDYDILLRRSEARGIEISPVNGCCKKEGTR